MTANKQRSEATRARLVVAFRELFLRLGFERTTTEMVLAETGLSKGALYHHFASKTEVAEEIYRATSHGAIERAMRSVADLASPLARLEGSCLAWLEEARDPAVAAILFELGPVALGPARAKQIEDEFSLRQFETILNEAIAQGEVARGDPALMARMLNAVMAEAALYRRGSGVDVAAAVRSAIRGILNP